MTGLFASGHAVDIVLVVMLCELCWLIGVAKWHPLDAVLRLAPGALMLLALRGALTGMGWPWIALPLVLSFPVHLADLARRPGGSRRRAQR